MKTMVKVKAIVRTAIGMGKAAIGMAIVAVGVAYGVEGMAQSNGSNIQLGDRTITQGTGWTYANNTWTVLNNANVTVTGSTNDAYIVTADNATATVTLEAITITNGGIRLGNNSKLKIILKGQGRSTILGREMPMPEGCLVEGYKYCKDNATEKYPKVETPPRPGDEERPGIEVPAGTELTVEALPWTLTIPPFGTTIGMGSLYVRGSDERPGIGPMKGQSMGKVIINSGFLTVRGGYRWNWGEVYEACKWPDNTWHTWYMLYGYCGVYVHDWEDVGRAASIGNGWAQHNSGGEIIINGGHIEAQDGIGIGNKNSNAQGTVTINGGTLTTFRLGFANENSVVINGGSVSCSRLGHTDLTDEGSIKNAAGTTLYPVKIGVSKTITEGSAYTTLNNPVTNSTFDNIILDYAPANVTPNPAIGIYGIKDVQTDYDGYLYFWLPTTGTHPLPEGIPSSPLFKPQGIISDIALTVGDKTYIATESRPTQETTIYATQTTGAGNEILITTNSSPVTISTAYNYNNNNTNATVNVKDLTSTYRSKGVGQINVNVTEGPFTVTPANYNFATPGNNYNFIVKPDNNLAPGTYTGQITIKGTPITLFDIRYIPVKFIVTKTLQAALTIADFGGTKPYSTATFTATATGGTGTGAITWSSSNTAVATVTAAGLVTLVAPGTTDIIATKAGGTNYENAVATRSLTVTLGQRTGYALPTSITKVSTDAPFTLSEQGTLGTGTTVWESTNSSVATVDSSTGLITLLSAGVGGIRATRPANTHYAAATATAVLNVARADQATLTVNQIPDKTYGDPNFQLSTPTTGTGAGSGTGTVTWTALTNNINVTTTGTVTITGTGLATIQATKAQDPKYNSTTATYSFDIAKKTQPTLNVISPYTSTYGDKPFVIVYSGGISSILPDQWTSDNHDVATVALAPGGSGLVTIKTAGTVNITAHKPGNDNYLPISATLNITINKATITVTPRNITKVYGDEEPELTYDYTLKYNDSPGQVFTGTLARTQGENAGNYDITQGTLNVNDNYILDFVEGSQLTITKAPLTVTPRDTTKVYGDDDPQLPYGWSTLKNNDTPDDVFTGTLARTQGENVDSYDILTDGLNVSDNYNVNFSTAARLTITKAPLTVTTRDTTKVYGDDDPQLPYSWSTLKNNDTPDDVFTGTLSRTQGENVDHYDILTDGLHVSDNYNTTFVNGARLNITKAPLTVTLKNIAKVYGDDDPQLPYEWSILKNNDTPEEVFTGTLSRMQGNNVDSYDILTDGLNVSDNYNTTFVTGAKLNITKAPLTVTPRNTSKVYGEVDPELTYEWANLKYNDSPDKVFTGKLSRTQGHNAGNYDITQGTLKTNGNYTVNFVEGVQLNITKAPLTVTPRDISKVYGEVDPELPYSWSALKNNDTPDEVFTGSLSRATGQDAGNYDILAEGLNVSNNYDVNFVTGARLTITKAPLTITLRDTTKVYGSVDPVLPYSWSALKNNDTPDKVFTGALTRAQGDDVGTYDISQEGLTVSNNYNTTFVTGAKLTVTKATLTVTASGANAVYLEPIPDLTLSYSGFVLGEDSTVLTTLPTATTTAVTGDSVGTYPINVAGAEAENYSFNYKDGKLKINKRIPQDNDLYISPNNAVYTGKAHNVTVDTVGVTGFGKISGVNYNGSTTAPTNPGRYEITVYVAAGINYAAHNGLLVDILVIDKAPLDSVKLTVNNNATPDKALVIPKNIKGLGTITVKFNGNTDIPTTPGEYKVTVDHSGGEYYQDETDHEVGTYTIAGSGSGNSTTPLDNKTTKTTQGKVWASGTQLFIQAEHNDQVRIYTLGGQLVTTLSIEAGERKELTITQGFYVVVLDGKTHKVMVR